MAGNKSKKCPGSVVTDRLDDDEEIGPRMLARIAKHTGLKPEDL
ncbi:MAG: hypothetical protein ACK4HB_00850 [Candidatus Bipolaricaulia bacterium]